MPDATFRVVPFTAATLPDIRRWFTDRETLRWLGGPAWGDELLALRERSLVGQVYRGAIVLRAAAYVLLDGDGVPAALIDTETYDRDTRFDGYDADGPTFADAPGQHRSLAALSIVVDPARRRQGIGRIVIEAILSHPDLAIAEEFVAAIEPGNRASRTLFLAMGFRQRDSGPDWEGMLTFVRSRGN